MVFFCLHFLDLFRRPIYLHFDKKEKNSSNLGFFFSLGIYALLIMQFIQSDIFHHSSPKVIDQSITEISRRFQVFKDKVFTVSVVDDNSLAYVDPSIFTIVAKNVYMSSDDKGGYLSDFIDEKEIHICSENDFNTDEKVFETLGLNNSFCLGHNSFETFGYWDEPKLAYFSLELYICDNKTSKIQCQTPEEIEKFFEMKYFNLVYAGVKLDVENYTTPLSNKYRNDYKLIEPKLNKMMNIFLKTINIMTDDGFIFSHLTHINDLGFDSSETDFSFLKQNQIEEKNKPIFVCDFYTSRSIQSISRTYQKISEVFANVGGLMSFLMICGFALTYIENSLSLQVKIMNKLYSFQNPINQNLSKNIDGKQSQSPEKKSLMFPNNFPDPGSQLILPPMLNSKETLFGDKQVLPTIEDKNEELQSLDHILERQKKRSISYVPQQRIENPRFIPQKIIEDPMEREMSPIKPLGSKGRSETFTDLKAINKEKPKETLSNSTKLTGNLKNKRKPISLEQIKIDRRKSNAITEIQKFKDNEENQLSISFWEYLKFNFHKICKCCARGFKENLFNKAAQIYEKEVDIVNILQRLQEIEKLKFVLLNKRQIFLFNVLAKPMIYYNKSFETQKSGGIYLAEMKSAGLKDENLKKSLKYFEGQKILGRLTEVDNRLLKLMDQNIDDYKRFIEKNEAH